MKYRKNSSGSTGLSLGGPPDTASLEDMKAQEESAELAKMATESIHAGFPSPAQDYMEGVIDLNRELVRHPAATFYGRVAGDSMIDAGVYDGDILVIDKSLEPKEGDMAVCFVDGEFTLKFITYHNPSAGGPDTAREAERAKSSYSILEHKEMWLVPANPRYRPIHITEGNDFTIWGIVTYIISRPSKRR